MKKGVLFGLIFVFSIFSLAGVFAEACDLDVSLINQDPYPAIPGDYVKVVFQISGVDNPLCGNVNFELVEQYPLVFDSGQQKVYEIESGTFQKDYESFFLASYKVRIEEGALDGENPIEVRYRFAQNLIDETKEFDLTIDDTRADFEIHVKNYDSATRMINFEILNIAEVDVEALTVEIPKQDGIVVKGSKRNIVGDLDSNEYTTTEFEVIPTSGEIKLNIFYSDSINERRMIEKIVLYEPEYFEGRLADQPRSMTSTYITILIVVVIIGYLIYRRKRKKKLAQMKKHRH